MEQVKGYEVLKLVEHGRQCYVSTDYVTGDPLIRWLKYHPDISKELLFQWMYEMVRQFERFHRCRGNPCYQYVNPYSIIIVKGQTLYLLDLGSKKQEQLLRQMQRKGIRENFLSPDNLYYQKSSLEEDIFGIGKTIQYMLSATDPEPALRVLEKMKFQKIISKCLNKKSNKKYHSIQEILKQLPKIKQRSHKSKQKASKKIILAVLFIISVISVSFIMLYLAGQDETTEKIGLIDNERVQNDQAVREDADDLKAKAKSVQFDMGLLYFLELENYQKSQSVFSEIEDDKLAGYFAKLSGCLLDGKCSDTAGEMEQFLKKMEDSILDKEDVRYYLCLLRGYTLLDTKEAATQRIRIGEYCQDLESFDTYVNQTERLTELKENLAYAFEQTEELNLAAKQYEELLEMKEGESNREELFQKLASLYEKQGELDQAWAVCQEGMDELKDSRKLRLFFIRMLCQTPSVDRQICAQNIQKYLLEMPELAEEAEFLKLKREHEIRIEGGQVWVGK